MKNRKSILLVVLLLAVGFAAVSTTLYINGSTNINPNQDDFNVYYSDAYVNGVQDKSVITDDTHISFTTELSALGEKYVLDYEVANGSKNYDAELIMSCTSSNDYLNITNVFDDETILEARSTRNGTLTLELKKSNAGEDIDVTIECTIDANAIERTKLNENEIATNTTYVIEGNYVNENGTAIANANLVIFSDTPHYVTTDENGYMIYNGLERGEHEIYHVEDTLENIKNMTKEEIINTAKTTATFTTNTKEDLEFVNKSKLKDTNILTSEAYCEPLVGTIWEYDYVNGEQTLNVICDGTYKLETWGAQGGDSVNGFIGGYGGYSFGDIYLTQGNIYINVGGQGSKNSGAYSTSGAIGGYNGGGTSSPLSSTNHIYGSGGGATHISKKSGELYLFENQKELVLIVSGGGGGGRWQANYDASRGNGGSGGGYLGGTGQQLGSNQSIAYGGTQDSGGGYKYFSGTTIEVAESTGLKCGIGSFGAGANVIGGSAGGGGWYGGAGCFSAGAGGSSYIGNLLLTNKAMYCYNCEEEDKEDIKTISVQCAESTPTTNCAKKGNGYARITYLGTN